MKKPNFEIAQRLNALLTEKRVNASELARIVGVSPQAVKQWLDGDTSPRGKNLDATADYLNTTPAYLKFGESVADVAPQHPSNVVVWRDKDDEEVQGKIWIPLVKLEFSCGTGVDWEFHTEVIEKKSIPFDESFFKRRRVNAKDCLLCRANGDSNAPYLYDDDVFMIDQSDTAIRHGERYAFYFDGEAMLKKIYKRDGGLVLHSENERDYPDIFIPSDNEKPLVIAGRQFWRAG